MDLATGHLTHEFSPPSWHAGYFLQGDVTSTDGISYAYIGRWSLQVLGAYKNTSLLMETLVETSPGYFAEVNLWKLDYDAAKDDLLAEVLESYDQMGGLRKKVKSIMCLKC